MADRMQDDAMLRYRQMYSKAPNESNQKNNAPKKNDEQNPPKPYTENEDNSPTLHKPQSKSVLDVFMKDKEKSLILLLIVILLSEKADTMLILALMYLVI